MALTHAQPSVGTSATLLFAVPDTFNNRLKGTYAFQNNSSSPIFLGGPGVSSTNFGYKLGVGDSVVFDMGLSDVIYGCVASGTAVVNIIHITG